MIEAPKLIVPAVYHIYQICSVMKLSMKAEALIDGALEQTTKEQGACRLTLGRRISSIWRYKENGVKSSKQLNAGFEVP